MTTLPFTPSTPWLLYAFPWMPYPRRLTLYLREKHIPSHLITTIPVSFTPNIPTRTVPPPHPPCPTGSLPILVIPSAEKDENGNPKETFHIRQSMAIIHFLEEICERKLYGFDVARGSMLGTTLVERVRTAEILTLAEECTIAWNPVRILGTKAGTIPHPAGAKELLRWVRRSLLAIENYFQASDRDMVPLASDSNSVTVADVVLYQFLEFTRDCYGVDMSVGSGGKVTDVYGREVVEDFPKVREFFEVFGGRESARREREIGEVPGREVVGLMSSWGEGVLGV